MAEHTLKELKTYRYELLNNSSEVRRVMYVLHGYGQLARYFIRKFSDLPKDVLIVAPEGMHRFYLEGSSGRVGASWMTKEARLTDIEDNINWLNKLHSKLSNEYQIEKQYVLGFSQGGATAARWNEFGNVGFDAIVLWACVFPPDLTPSENAKLPSNSFFVVGTNDPYFNNENRRELLSEYKKYGFKTFTFDGEHTIHTPTLSKLLKEIK